MKNGITKQITFLKDIMLNDQSPLEIIILINMYVIPYPKKILQILFRQKARMKGKVLLVAFLIH
jgi:hypothetical protein